MLRGSLMDDREAAPEQPRAVRSSIRFLATLEMGDGLPVDVEVVNISESGARVQLPDQYVVGPTMRLGFGRLGTFECEVVWSNETHAGVKFLSGPTHVAKLIAEHFHNFRDADEQRQYIRSSILWKGELRAIDGLFSTTCSIFDISAGGARIRFAGRLPTQVALELRIERLGAFPVEVIWTNGAEFGLKFLVPPKRMAEVLGDLLPLCRVFPGEPE